MRVWLRLCLPAALFTACAAWAQPGDGPPPGLQAERARIAAERAQVTERFAAEERICHQRFAVNDCLKANRNWQRGVLDGLRRQEVLLNDGERQRKAAEQLHKLDDKRDAHAQDAAARAATPAPPTRSDRVAPPQAATPGAAAPARTPDTRHIQTHQDNMRRKQERHDANQARRAEQAAQAEALSRREAARQRAAAEHKASVLKRNAENPSTAKPLPVPLP